MGVPDVKCAPISEAKSSVGGVSLAFGIVGAVGVLVAAVATALAAGAAAATTPGTLEIWAVALAASCLVAINFVHTVLDVLFHYKLACIDGERCLMGQVQKIELNPDGDTTFNMKLAPIQDTTTVADFKASHEGSTLVYSDPGAASRGWVFKPESGAGFVSSTQPIPLLHCEIEGSYLNDWLTALLAWLWSVEVLAIAAAVLAATELIPVVGWIIWAALLLLAILALLFGIHFAGGTSDEGSADPDVPVGEKSPGSDGPVLTDAANNKVAVGDYIVLTGLHVLDCGHADDKDDDGSPKGTWCEIHPVRGIAKISKRVYDDYSSGIDFLTTYCDALKKYLETKGLGETATSTQALEHPRIG